MDITCGKCGEPFDTYHLLHDEIWETDLAAEVIKGQWRSRLTPVFEAAFNRLGWRFVGHNLLAVAQCPACKDEPETPESKARAEIRGAIAEVLGDDLDGLAVELEELARQEERR